MTVLLVSWSFWSNFATWFQHVSASTLPPPQPPRAWDAFVLVNSFGDSLHSFKIAEPSNPGENRCSLWWICPMIYWILFRFDDTSQVVFWSQNQHYQLGASQNVSTSKNPCGSLTIARLTKFLGWFFGGACHPPSTIHHHCPLARLEELSCLTGFRQEHAGDPHISTAHHSLDSRVLSSYDVGCLKKPPRVCVYCMLYVLYICFLCAINKNLDMMWEFFPDRSPFLPVAPLWPESRCHPSGVRLELGPQPLGSQPHGPGNHATSNKPALELTRKGAWKSSLSLRPHYSLFSTQDNENLSTYPMICRTQWQLIVFHNSIVLVWDNLFLFHWTCWCGGMDALKNLTPPPAK